MAIEGGAKVDLQDGGELVGVHEVNDGDGPATQHAQDTGGQDQPVAPAKRKNENNVLDSEKNLDK